MATKPSLALIPSGYKASKVYSVLPTNGDGDFDFSRTGTATRVNKDGLIETVDANVPRLDYSNGGCPSLLLEDQRTNLLTYSEDFSQSVWDKIYLTNAPSQVISPNGISKATLLTVTDDTTENYCRQSTSLVSIGNKQTVSFFVKKGTSDFCHILLWDTSDDGARQWFDLNNGVIGVSTTFGSDVSVDSAKMIEYANDWYRCVIVFNNLNTNIQTRISLSNVDGDVSSSVGKTIYVWGAQLEQERNDSSYIPTLTGSISTRYADICNRTNIQEYIGQTEGTIFLDFEYLMDVGTDLNDSDLADEIWIGSSTDSSEYIYIDNYLSRFRVYVEGSLMGTKSLGLNSAGSSLANTRYKVALKYKNNDFKCYRNGILIGSATGVVNFASPLNSFYFSWFNNSFGQNKKRVNDLRIYKTGLTDQELIQLTTI